MESDFHWIMFELGGKVGTGNMGKREGEANEK
jgi:hypothetical protein